jgi:DNA-binding MarR family transcriptional regulator
MKASQADTDFAASLRDVVFRLGRWQRSESAREPGTLPHSLSSVLSTLDRWGPATPSQLAKMENIKRSSITRIAIALEGKGYVTRGKDPVDGRQSIVAITANGRNAVNHRRRYLDRQYLDLMATLPQQEQQILRAAIPVLTRLAQGISDG